MPTRQIFVSLHGGGTEALNVDASVGAALVFVLKRRIHQAFGINPLEQRLTLNGQEDSFSLETSVQCVRRTRAPNVSVTIHSMNLDEYEVTLDPSDNVVDLKFILAEMVKCDPEYVRLWTNKLPLPDSALVSDCGVLNPENRIRMMYCLPSNQLDHGEIHRSTMNDLRVLHDPQSDTLAKNFRNTARKYPDFPFLGTRAYDPSGRGKYEWLSYKDAGVRVSNIAAGLAALGIQKGESVGIISLNRAEWQLTDLACFTQAFCSVPLYDTLGPDAITFILNHVQIKAVVCNKAQLNQICEALKTSPSVKFVIMMDDDPMEKEFAASQRASNPQFTHTLSELELLGSQNPIDDAIIDPNDVATVQYTSGTTGNPKGVVLTHISLLVAAGALTSRLPEDESDDGSQIFLSYLPLAHSYGRLMEIMAISYANAIGYFQGDQLKLVDDVEELKPTFFPGVPRVWQKVYDGITAQIEASNPIRRFIFSKAYATQTALVQSGQPRSEFWDRIVFSKISARFGGNLKLISSGAAPISAKVATFLLVCLGCRFIEGYGLSETNSAGCTTSEFDTEYGHVGTPLPVIEVKLVSIPDMKYLITDKPNPRGEIWVRGPTIFREYYKQPEKTAECFEDGWFLTGDVGMWRDDGNLQIIDRKKNIFKLSQGEYIRPEHIENVYKMNKFITNAFVYGHSLEDFLVAIIVPEFAIVSQWAKSVPELEPIADNPSELIKSERLKAFILSEMRKVGESEGLRGFEHAKRIHLHHEDFTVESGLLTPSMKLKRHQAKEAFADQIDKMYKEPIPSKL